MLSHLLQPIINQTSDYQAFQFGSQVLPFSGIMPEGVKIGLLTWGAQVEDFQDFRKAFYSLAANAKRGQFVDFGNIIGGKFGASEVIDQLLQQKIFPILVSNQAETVSAVVEAQRMDSLEISLIDSHLGDNLQQAQAHYPQRIFHCNHIGYQSYFVDDAVLDAIEERHHTAYRLSYLRAQLEEIEPIMRDSDIFYLHLPAVRAADAPATLFANPNGFSAEEACRIVRYAAMADRLSCLAIGGYDNLVDDRQQTARLLAQLVWFGIEGHYNRKNEYPLDKQRLTKYIVESHWVDFPLQFFKSPRSERWWFWVPLPEGVKEDYTRYQLVACSYNDYQKACEGELPQRLLDAYRRFE